LEVISVLADPRLRADDGQSGNYPRRRNSIAARHSKTL
jgi:hypothetical protein